jgi:hypothetical protein
MKYFIILVLALVCFSFGYKAQSYGYTDEKFSVPIQQDSFQMVVNNGEEGDVKFLETKVLFS